jgi:hypothetical protein
MSGNYVNSIVQQAANDVCEEPAASYSDESLMKLYPNGVASEALTPDSSTGRISTGALADHVARLEGAGIIKRRPQIRVADGDVTGMDELVKNDAFLFNVLHSEYCHYEQRYKYAMKRFLALATSRNVQDNDAAQNTLTMTRILNLRLNSVLEIMNYLAQQRVDMVNKNKDNINSSNADINTKLQQLKNNFNMMASDDAIVRTQKASVIYTEEKNRYTTNQIAVWLSLNALAIGTIFYVYRS